MRFLLVFSTILIFGYTYIGSQLILPLELSATWNAVAWLIFCLPFGLILWLPLSYWRKELNELSQRDEQMLWAAYLSLGFLSFLLFFVAARDLFLLGARLWGGISGILLGSGLIGGLSEAASGWIGGPARVPLALLDWRGSVVILFLAIATLLAGFREARRGPSVTRVNVPIPNLSPALEGLTIAQISDLHVGPTIQRPFVEKVIEMTNALDADVIALTGDIADGSVQQLEPHAAPLALLKARLGRFYVTGNHEHYWEAQEWIEHFKKLGITPLVNSHSVIQRNGVSAVVAGVLDVWSGSYDPRAALTGAPQEAALKILLSHQPKTALDATTLGYDLQLSGHTHGGQFLPWTQVVGLFQPFVQGLYRVGKMWLYVNRGTGYWGPPVRLGSPAEITLLRLIRA